MVSRIDSISSQKYGKEIWSVFDTPPIPENGISGINSKVFSFLQSKNIDILGTFVGRALISDNGTVDTVIVVKSIANLIDNEAVRVIISTKFTPARVKNKPVYSWLSIPISFSIKD